MSASTGTPSNRVAVNCHRRSASTVALAKIGIGRREDSQILDESVRADAAVNFHIARRAGIDQGFRIARPGIGDSEGRLDAATNRRLAAFVVVRLARRLA